MNKTIHNCPNSNSKPDANPNFRGGGGNCPDTNLQLHSTIQIYFQRLTSLYSKIHIYIQRLTFLFNKFYSTELDNMVPKMSLSYKKIIQRGKS